MEFVVFVFESDEAATRGTATSDSGEVPSVLLFDTVELRGFELSELVLEEFELDENCRTGIV